VIPYGIAIPLAVIPWIYYYHGGGSKLRVSFFALANGVALYQADSIRSPWVVVRVMLNTTVSKYGIKVRWFRDKKIGR
jgi:hypothetical protein